MERLESFVAGSLLLRLHRLDAPSSTSACTSFRGAVLFVDISGYTALAETLCNEGPEGVEQLGRVLDHAFGRYVRVMQDTGGEIACFAGDAFIAYWPADDGNIPRVLHKAHEAARALHAVSRSSAPGNPPPTLHIGLSAGDIWAARLGSEERWQLLLAGPAVRQACSAAAGAAAGTTMVAPDAGPFMASTSTDVGVARSPTEAASAPMIPLDLGGHVPRRVQDYLAGGYDAWIPERRRICALFVKIDGLDDRAPDALSRHQAVVTSLHVALRPYTSATGTLLLDDKGLVLTLCLGMPHDAHADDAVRAVRAGLAIRSELSRLGMKCGIGIALGDGVCMPLGGPERRHYWSVGRFMHIAGRLMEAADGGVLCTEEVAERVRRVVSLSPERPLTLKGVRWPLHAFRIREAFNFADRNDGLYGREDEQAVIDRRLAAFENGEGTVLSFVGDAGIGKTALVDYLRRAATRRGIACLSGGAGSVEIGVAYSAWRPVFAKLFGDQQSSRPEPQDQRRARLETIPHPELAPLVNAVVPGLYEETPLVQSITGQARADATAMVLSEVLQAYATDRFVLILEDCHWMDAASWGVLVRVVQDQPQALIVLTSRPPADPQERGALRTLPRSVEITLSTLRPDATTQLVESVLQGRWATPERIAEVAHLSSGNPLLAREYALLVSAVGDHPEAQSALPVPRSVTNEQAVKSLITSRLDALPPAEALALKIASVIGDDFAVDLVAGVYSSDANHEVVERLLRRLVQRQLLACAGVGDRFTFQHALIRDATYEQLTNDQKQDLHRRVAETLERQCASDLRGHVATLAHHWSRVLDAPETAIRYSEEAASEALAAGAFATTERLLNTCITLARQSNAPVTRVQQIRWQRQLADARHGMGQLETRIQAAHEALSFAGVRRPRLAAAHLVQAGVRWGRLHLGTVPPVVVDGTDMTMEVARAFRHSAEVCYFSSDPLGMLCDDVGAWFHARALPVSEVLVGAYAELGGIVAVVFRRATGERILQEAIAMAEAAGDPAAQAYGHMIRGLYYVGLGDWATAQESVSRCQEICKPMHDRVNWTNAQGVQFWMGHYQSHYARAYEAACHLRDRASETGNRQHHAWGQRFLALCALRRNAPREAVAHLREAREYVRETVALNERLPTAALLALAQLKSGDTQSARATAWDALPQIYQEGGLIRRVKRPIGHATLEGYSALLTVALDAWHEPARDWRPVIRDCLRALDKYRKALPIGEPRYCLHLGNYQWRLGDVRAAARSYARGAAAAAPQIKNAGSGVDAKQLRLGMPWDAAQCKEAGERLNTKT